MGECLITPARGVDTRRQVIITRHLEHVRPRCRGAWRTWAGGGVVSDVSVILSR